MHLAKLLQRLARPKESRRGAACCAGEGTAHRGDDRHARTALARLAAAMGDWKEMRELKAQAVELKSLPTVLVITRELATHERRVEALNLSSHRRSAR